MAYKKRPDIKTDIEDESVLELEDGTLVAVRCGRLRCTSSQNQIFEPQARWIDKTGKTRADAHGNDVFVVHRHSALHSEIDRLGHDAVVKACLCLVLGEPVPTYDNAGTIEPIIDFGPAATAAASVRNAIRAASNTHSSVNVGDLL